MSTSRRALAVALLAVVSAEETADQARSTLLLYKKLSQADGHSVNTPFNVTLTVYNRGERPLPALCSCLQPSLAPSISALSHCRILLF